MSENQRPTMDYGDLAYHIECAGHLAYALHQALWHGHIVSKDAAEAAYGLNLLIEHIEEEARQAEDAELSKARRKP